MNKGNVLHSDNSDSKSSTSANGKEKKSKLLIGILIAIFLGTLVGGWFPDIALKFSILGEVFLNSLMMLVVPLVVLSLIVGITRLGDIRNLGSLGGRTVAYYIVTTSIAVLIGIVIVNIIQPGKGIRPGEIHLDYSYTVGGENNHTIFLSGKKWEKEQYSDKYIIILLDQRVQGIIESFTYTSVTVGLWESVQAEDKFYIVAEDGTQLQFQRIGRQLVSA
jgi:hypothetical protein